MNKLWGGRFNKKTNKLVEDFSRSIQFDQKLAKYDCIGSLYHIDVLRKAKLLTIAEHAKLKKGLKSILISIEKGPFFKNIDTTHEDIHSYIQALLEKKAGMAALKLHTCRSRNDQVVFDTKLYCLDHLTKTVDLIILLDETLHKTASKNKDIIIPGYTHLQHAIPISLYDYFSAYHEMLFRDIDRLADAFVNIELTFGAGALAGTFINHSHYVQKATKGIPKPIKSTTNAIDVVSDRDYIIESLSVLAIIGMHLSRLAEDLILWASKEFSFIDIDDAFCTGSSLMPQKKNPDVLELIRGNTGVLYGNLINVLVVMKGLPLSYNRDMQHDKEPLFKSFEITQQVLEILTELFKNIAFNKESIAKQLDDEFLYATDIADYLVQKGVPFKTAHSLIGTLIQTKIKKKTNLLQMDDKTLKSIYPDLNKAVLKKIINPKQSVQAKKSVKRK